MQEHYPLDYIPDGEDKRDFSFDKKTFKQLTRNKRSKILGSLPKEIDHTKNMTPVKDQGKFGSCVAFATAALKEWQEWQEYLKIYEGDLNKNVFSDLSEQWIYYKAKEIDNIESEGTTIRAALKVLKNIGVPPESYWKYNPQAKGKPKGNAEEISELTKIDFYFRIKSLAQMKLALLHTPVPIGIMIFDNFYNPSYSGVVNLPGTFDTKLGGHAVCSVGYNDNNKIIKIKNSHGTKWANSGYGYITYDYFKKYCMAAWAVKNVHVPVGKIKELVQGSNYANN